MQVTKKMLKAFKGKPTIIAVAPGDYGSKYFPLEGWQKAHNRALDERHRNRLLKDWNLELAGLVTLVVNETGDKIFIIDGQHRIAACSMMDDPQILLARIYTFDEIPMSVENWVTEINAKQKSFKLNDYLATYQEYSYWPQVFEDEGVTVKFSSSRIHPRWSAVIGAIRYGTELQKHQSLVAIKRMNQKNAILLWESEDLDTIRRAAKFVKWWTPFIKMSNSYGIGGIGTAVVMGLGFVIYEENKGRHGLNKAADRLLTWPSAKRISLYRRGTEDVLPALREALIFGMNRNAKNGPNLLTLFGYTGRGL